MVVFHQYGDKNVCKISSSFVSVSLAAFANAKYFSMEIFPMMSNIRSGNRSL